MREQWLVSAQIFHVYLQSFLWLIWVKDSGCFTTVFSVQRKSKSRQLHAFYFVYVNLPFQPTRLWWWSSQDVWLCHTNSCIWFGGEAQGGAGGAGLPKQTLPYKEISLKLSPKCQISLFLKKTEPNAAIHAVRKCFISLVPFISELLKGQWLSEIDWRIFTYIKIHSSSGHFILVNFNVNIEICFFLFSFSQNPI